MHSNIFVDIEGEKDTHRHTPRANDSLKTALNSAIKTPVDQKAWDIIMT